MNFVLYIHDQGENPVWPYEIGITDKVAAEIGELVSDYTMGRVSIDVVPNDIPDTRRPKGDGHNFQIMCSACLDEPLDVEDIYGPCPEWEDDTDEEGDDA